MAERVIDIVIRGKNLTTEDFAAARKELRELEKANGDVSQSNKSAGDSFGAFAAKAAIAGAALYEVLAVAGEWISASNAQESATAQLNTALKAQGTLTKTLSDQYADLASEFERTTGNADELLMSMEAMLIQIGNVGPKDMRAALTAATDLSAGLGIDLTTATKAVAKAFDGGGTAIGKFLPSLKETIKDGASTEEVLAALHQRFGGQAQAQMQTYGGKMKGIANIIDNTKESMGDIIKSGLTPLVDAFMGLPSSVQTGAVALGVIAAGGTAVVTAVTAVSAAIAMAAPLLGMPAAAVGTAALGALGTAAGAAAAAFLPLSAAIAAVWAAWKIGNTETVKNGIAEWGLSSDNLTAKLWRAIGGTDQMTAAAAHAAVAATAAAVAAQAHAKATDEQGTSAGRAKPQVESLSAQLAAVQKEVSNLTAEQRSQIKAGDDLHQSSADITKALKAQHPEWKVSEEAVKLYTDSLKKSAEGGKKAAQDQKELTEFIKKTNQELSRLGPNVFKASEEVTKASERMGQDIIAGALLQKKTQDEINAVVYERTRSRVDFQIEQVNRWAYNELLALEKVGAASTAAQKDLDALKQLKIDKIIEDDQVAQMILFANLNTEAKKRVEALNLSAKTAAYDGLANFFQSLAQINGHAGLSGFMGAIAQMALGFKSANDQGNQIGKTAERLGGSFGSLSVAFNDNATGTQKFAAGIQAATSIASGAVGIFNAVANSSTRMGASFNGAMAGLEAGAAFGPWGAAAGAAVGVVAGLFKNTLKKEVEAANKEINKVHDSLLKQYGTLENLDAVAARVGLTFSDAWGHQGKAGLEATNKLAEQLKERLEAVDGAIAKVSGGFSAVVTGMAKPWIEFGKNLDAAYKKTGDAETKFKKAVADADAEYAKALTDPNVSEAQLNDLHKKQLDGLQTLRQAMYDASNDEQEFYRSRGAHAAEYKQQLADLGVQAIASFGAAMVAGKSYSESIALIGPSIATLGQSYKALGLNVEDVGLKHLIVQSTVAKGNPELIAAASGLGSSMQGLAQLGMLNVDTFGAMQRTGSAMYSRLQGEVGALGGDSRDALLPMQGYLQQAAAQAHLLGIPLDANTEMLIEQSRELGLWKDKGKSAQDLLIEGMQTLVGTVGELLTRMLGVNSAITAIPPRTDAVVNITKNEYTNEFVNRTVDETVNRSAGGGAGRGDAGGGGGDNGGDQPPPFARGTFGALGYDFPDFGRGTRAILHAREAVVPYADRIETAQRWLGQAGGASPSISVAAPNIYIVGDTSREARQVTESEFKQIQARLDGGGLQVPARAITQRGR